jgi:Glycosyltransferase WbsX
MWRCRNPQEACTPHRVDFRDAETVRHAVRVLTDQPATSKLLCLKAWNEWAEGNHLEPDLRYGHGWLEALQRGAAG